MLDAMRRGVANLFTKLLLGLLIIAFAVWGVGDYIVRGPSQSNALATVGGTEITPEAFRQTFRDEVQSIERQLGGKLTPEQAKLLGIPPRALARLIGRTAIDIHANDLGVTVSDVIMRGSIMADPAFQGLDGKFSRERFRQAYVQQGYGSEAQYVDARQRDIERQQLTETLGAGVAPPKFLVDVMHRFREEKRVIEYITPDFAELITVAEPSENNLKEFFERSKGKYVAPEQRKAGLMLLTRDQALSRVKVSDEEVKAAYEAAKDSYDVPEKRRISQLTFSDKAAAEKAYAKLSKAENFKEAAAKLGFPAADIRLGPGPLTKADMIDPKIADAAFKLKLNELSRPVEGKFSVVLLRVTEIQEGKERAFDDVKGEIRKRLAGERAGDQIQALYEQVEDGRSKGTPLKEIAERLKLPFQEIASIDHAGKTAEGKAAIAHADAKRITEAIFGAIVGVETEALDLSDGGYGWFSLLNVTPQRQRAFDEVQAQVRADFAEAEQRKKMASLAAKQVERLKNGEGLDAVAKSIGAKVERTPPVKRSASPPPAGLTAVALRWAFALAKGDAASAPTADGASRTIFRVADVIAAPEPTPEQAAALKAELAKQVRADILDQYVAGLRTRYKFTVNEKAVLQALGLPTGSEADN